MKTNKGVTLIEIMIVLAITMLILTGMLNYVQLIYTNAKLRSAAEELKSGLQIAKVEAVKRNTLIDFENTASGAWRVILVSTGEILQSKVVNTNIVTVDGVNTVTDDAITRVRLNAYGRPTLADGSGTPVNLRYTNIPLSGVASCKAAGGEFTCMNVVMSMGGQLRVCNPATQVELQRCPV